MPEDQNLEQLSAEQRRTNKIIEIARKLAYWQEQALGVPCPYCRSQLKKNDLGSVFCPHCGKIYHCQILVASQSLYID